MTEDLSVASALERVRTDEALVPGLWWFEVRNTLIVSECRDLRALAQLADKNPETVMLHFVQPTGSNGRAVDECGFARADETDHRDSSPTGRGSAPRRADESGAFHRAEASSLAAALAGPV
jgi:hypothetical protein